MGIARPLLACDAFEARKALHGGYPIIGIVHGDARMKHAPIDHPTTGAGEGKIARGAMMDRPSLEGNAATTGCPNDGLSAQTRH